MNVTKKLNAVKNPENLCFHNILQNQFHTKICTFSMVKTSTRNETMELCIQI